MVGKGQFHMLASTLNISQVEIQPLSITSIDDCAFLPIERNSAIATQCSTIIQIKTKEHWLVRSDRQIELCDLFSHNSIHQTEKTCWTIGCQVKPRRHRLIDCSSNTIVATYCHTKCHISILHTFINNSKFLQES